MMNSGPAMLDLMVRDRHDALQLGADRRRLVAAARPARPRADRRGRRPSPGVLGALRSLGARAVPALNR